MPIDVLSVLSAADARSVGR